MSDNPSDLSALLAAQRAAYRRDGAPSLDDRRADLSKLRAALIANRSRIEAAVDTDFGHRSRHETSIQRLSATIGRFLPLTAAGRSTEPQSKKTVTDFLSPSLNAREALSRVIYRGADRRRMSPGRPLLHFIERLDLR